ncbi:MAG: hypothetical protein R3B13_06900 [Polyangiaceae bacterium]
MMTTAKRIVFAFSVLGLTACSSDDGSGNGGASASGGQAGAGANGSGGASGGVGSGGTAAAAGSSGGNAGNGGAAGSGGSAGSTQQACPSPLPSDWIFCEDFESVTDTKQVFFEHNDDDGDFKVVSGEGTSGTHALEASYQKGEVEAGWVSVAFGRNPIVGAGKPQYRATEDFSEVWWRLRVKHEQGWPDVGPAKLMRATSFAKSNWGQAMIAHLWSSGVQLLGDPASCVSGGSVACNQYNDFANLQWLGQMKGTTPLFSSALSGQWHCVEGHVKLNAPGQKDGQFEFWIDGNLENSRKDLDWRGTYSDYGVNLISVENYWNSGAVQDLKRWFDDIAIAQLRIGCG